MKLLFIVLSLVLLTGAEANAGAGSLPLPCPVNSCMSCGEILADDPVVLIYGGRELEFCSLICVSTFTKSPETYISNLIEQIKIFQRVDYPLTTCIISGHDLGSMGDPVEYVSGNTLIKFCCPACIEPFEKDREQMLKKFEDAGSKRK